MHAATNRPEAILFFGEMTPSRARVYFRLDEKPGPDREPQHSNVAQTPQQFQGTLYGPVSPTGRTLPARHAFRCIEREGTWLAEALIPDPCFWSPSQPLAYEYQIEIQDGGAAQGLWAGQLGLRRVGLLGPNLVWNGDPWSLIGVPPDRLTSWLDSISDDPLAVCSVLLSASRPADWDLDLHPSTPAIGVLPADAGQAEAAVRNWARYPQVYLLILPDSLDATRIRQVGPNLLLAGTKAVERALDFQLATESTPQGPGTPTLLLAHEALPQPGAPPNELDRWLAQQDQAIMKQDSLAGKLWMNVAELQS